MSPRTSMSSVQRTLPLVLVLLLLAACRGKTGVDKEIIPSNVYVALNINADDTGPTGAFGRALFVVDLDTREPYLLPFTYMAGGPAWGQPQHAVISPDRRKVYVTVGGDATLPLRLLTIKLQWHAGRPTPKITNTLEILPAGSQGTNSFHAHGLTISPDGLLLFMSELLAYPAARLRVVDTRTDTFVTPSSGAFVDPGDQSLDMPHGFFFNPAMTRGVSTQYRFDRDKVTVWNIESNATSTDFGKLTHAATITLDTGGGAPKGAYTHTAYWRNDTEFYVCCTQETTQGNLAGAEAGLWHVNITNINSPVVTQVIGEGVGGVLEGVSDVFIAKGSLFLAEGNLEKANPPGHISMWDISGRFGGTATVPVFIKRLSAGTGLPTDFLEAHGLAKTADDNFVICASYRTHYVVLMSAVTGNVLETWGPAHGLTAPHGGYAQ